MCTGHSAPADSQHLELPDEVSKAQLHIGRSFSAAFPTERSPVPFLQFPDWIPLLWPVKDKLSTNTDPVALKCVRQQGFILDTPDAKGKCSSYYDRLVS